MRTPRSRDAVRFWKCARFDVSLHENGASCLNRRRLFVMERCSRVSYLLVGIASGAPPAGGIGVGTLFLIGLIDCR